MKKFIKMLFITILGNTLFAALIGTVVGSFAPVFAILMCLSLFVPGVNGAVFDLTFTKGLADVVRNSIVDLYGKKSPFLLRTGVGLTKFLQSSTNTAGSKIDYLTSEPGKKKWATIKIPHKRDCENIIVDTPVQNCDYNFENEPDETAPFAIDLYHGTDGFIFEEDEMRKLAEGDAGYMEREIATKIDALIRSFNRKLWALSVAEAGVFYPSIAPATVKGVNLLYGDQDLPLAHGESIIAQDMARMQINSRGTAVGGGNLDTFMRQITAGTNYGGIDMIKGRQFDYYQDFQADSEMGTDEFLMMIPGYTQLLTQVENVGPYQKENDVFSHYTIMDPETGLKIDMNWHYNDCKPRNYTMDMGFWFKLVFLPGEAFKYCDPLYNVNFMFKYKANKLAE